MDASKELSQRIHLQPYTVPCGSVVTLGPTAAPWTAARQSVRGSVGLLSQDSGRRTSEAKRRAGSGSPEASLLTLSLRVLTWPFLSRPILGFLPSSRGHDRSWSNDPPHWPHFNLIAFLQALSPNIVIF